MIFINMVLINLECDNVGLLFYLFRLQNWKLMPELQAALPLFQMCILGLF